MTQEKVIFIIPGFRHKPTNKTYKELTKILKSEGYHPIRITIPWKKTTISENVSYFLTKYKKIKARKKYILGFSYGAMIAFIASTKVNVYCLILCSLSPYFKEDLPKARSRVISLLMTQRFEDFSRLHCGSLAKKIKAKRILMLYGAKEAKPLINRVTQAFDQISSNDKHLIPIKKTEHNIGDRRYIKKIHQIARELI